MSRNILITGSSHGIGAGCAIAFARDEGANIGITCNKNTIPFDPASPFVTSGIRLGTPAATTRGFKEEDFKEVAVIMGLVLNNPTDAEKHAEAAQRVAALCAKYPMYPNIQ